MLETTKIAARAEGDKYYDTGRVFLSVRLCYALSDTCRGEVVAALCVDRQVSDKAQGRKPRAGLGSELGPVRSMGNRRHGGGGPGVTGLLDRGTAGRCGTAGSDWRRL